MSVCQDKKPTFSASAMHVLSAVNSIAYGVIAATPFVGQYIALTELIKIIPQLPPVITSGFNIYANYLYFPNFIHGTAPIRWNSLLNFAYTGALIGLTCTALLVPVTAVPIALGMASLGLVMSTLSLLKLIKEKQWPSWKFMDQLITTVVATGLLLGLSLSLLVPYAGPAILLSTAVLGGSYFTARALSPWVGKATQSIQNKFGFFKSPTPDSLSQKELNPSENIHLT